MLRPLYIRIVIAVILFSFIGYLYYSTNYAMYNLPHGDFIQEIKSPEGDLSIKIYIYSPALSANAIRGELVFNSADEKPKNIYWCLYENDAEVKWIDNRTVSINEKVIDVFKEKFDWRNE
ncbi:MAG: hypothetical protein HWE21_11395 [Cytophagia bacterium]|nr:hypothetical protein [Cytophagia bacterium]